MTSVPGWSTISNPEGAFGDTVQDPTQINQQTLVPVGGGGGNATELQGVAVSATTPTTSQALVYNGTAWTPTTLSGTGTVTSASVVSANGFAGTVATPTSTPAITLETTITGLLKGNATAISAATAGTDYVTPTGSGASLTGITASQVGALPSTDDLSAIAAANATAANWSNNSHKITSLGAATTSGDALSYGGTAGGDLSGTLPSPTVAAIQGHAISATAPTTGQYLEWNGTSWAPTTASAGGVASVAAADASIVVGGTGTNPTVATGTLDVIATQHGPVASVPMNSQKLTGLAAGTTAGDSVRYEQAALLAGTQTFTGTYTFNNVVTLVGGTATTAITSGTLPALSTIMSHVAAGTTGTADQNTTGRDIQINVDVISTGASAAAANLQISPDGTTYTTVWRFTSAATNTGAITATANFKINKGWYVQWLTFSNVAIGVIAPNYY